MLEIAEDKFPGRLAVHAGESWSLGSPWGIPPNDGEALVVTRTNNGLQTNPDLAAGAAATVHRSR